MKGFLTVVILMLVFQQLFAQTSRESEINVQSKDQKSQKDIVLKSEAEMKEEYELLMKENEKNYKKIEKMEDDPQYSNPAYFGHKRPPKKRPVGKRKMCKECGIVH